MNGDSWYHSIELEPGVITKGGGHLNLASTRTAMAGVDLRGCRVLDIACADGLMSLLAKRRGAAEVIAWDRERRPYAESWPGVRHSYGNWNWLYRECYEFIRFDCVICSGLLYHTFDPLAWLLRARSVTRNGGVLVLETAAHRSLNSQSLVWNGGRYYGQPEQSNYWFPTIGLLREWLAFARLQPLKIAWQPSVGKIVRVAVCCRAVQSTWSAKRWLQYHEQCSPASGAGLTFSDVIDWDRCRSSADPVPVADAKEGWEFPPQLDQQTIERLSVLRLEDLV